MRDGAHATPGKTPSAHVAVNVAHDVMQQNISRTRRINTQSRSNNARARHGGFDQVIVKIVMQKICSTHREKADIFIEFALTEIPELLGHPEEFPNISWLE